MEKLPKFHQTWVKTIKICHVLPEFYNFIFRNASVGFVNRNASDFIRKTVIMEMLLSVEIQLSQNGESLTI